MTSDAPSEIFRVISNRARVKRTKPVKNTIPSIIHIMSGPSILENGSQRPPHIELKGKMSPITYQALYHAGNNHSMGVRIPAITGRYVNEETNPNMKRLTNLFL